MSRDDLPSFEEIVELLKPGQIWVPSDPDDYTLEIIRIENGEATIKQLETGEVYKHEMDGSDCFPDYLESNLYWLKE